MRKVFKISCVLCAVVALLSLSVFSVSAAGGTVNWTPTYVTLTECQAYFTSWQNFNSSFTEESGTNRGHFVIGFGAATPSKWRAVFVPTEKFPSYTVNDRYLQLNLSISYTQIVSPNYTPQTITGALYVTMPNGSAYEFPITSQTDISSETGVTTVSYLLRFGGVADVGSGFNLKDCTYEFRCTGLTNLGGLELYFSQLDFSFRSKYTEDTVKIVDSVEQGFADLENKIEQSTQDIINNQNSNTDKITDNQDANTDKIIGNQNSNTDEIINNQDANTDKITGSIEDSTDQITNGWETDDDTADKTDDAVNSLGSAEDEALGGKSDEEIKEEVNDALGQVTFPDQKPDNIIQVGIVFNDLLDAFGMQYQSLLILALSLGLGAFLVGRQYNAKG